jgi:hypothetical protein
MARNWLTGRGRKATMEPQRARRNSNGMVALRLAVRTLYTETPPTPWATWAGSVMKGKTGVNRIASGLR